MAHAKKSIKQVSNRDTLIKDKDVRKNIHGDPSAPGLGYVGISSVSYLSYPGTELMPT